MRSKTRACLAYLLFLGFSACRIGQVRLATVSPHLVSLSSDVWVVEDYPFATYYVDGHYWRFSNDTWLRSLRYDVGFERVDPRAVPPFVIEAYMPGMHEHFRAPDERTRAVIDPQTQRPQLPAR